MDTWYAIYKLEDGSLYSTGTVVASAEALTENGLAVYACPEGVDPQDGTWEWHPKKIKFVAIKAKEGK